MGESLIQEAKLDVSRDLRRNVQLIFANVDVMGESLQFFKRQNLMNRVYEFAKQYKDISLHCAKNQVSIPRKPIGN